VGEISSIRRDSTWFRREHCSYSLMVSRVVASRTAFGSRFPSIQCGCASPFYRLYYTTEHCPFSPCFLAGGLVFEDLDCLLRLGLYGVILTLCGLTRMVETSLFSGRGKGFIEELMR